MTSFVSCHLVYCIVDCIQVSSFCTFSKIEFTSCSAVLSFYAHFEVFLCAVSNNFAKEFCVDEFDEDFDEVTSED